MVIHTELRPPFIMQLLLLKNLILSVRIIEELTIKKNAILSPPSAGIDWI